jgi:hypothetical protein
MFLFFCYLEFKWILVLRQISDQLSQKSLERNPILDFCCWCKIAWRKGLLHIYFQVPLHLCREASTKTQAVQDLGYRNEIRGHGGVLLTDLLAWMARSACFLIPLRTLPGVALPHSEWIHFTWNVNQENVPQGVYQIAHEGIFLVSQLRNQHRSVLFKALWVISVFVQGSRVGIDSKSSRIGKSWMEKDLEWSFFKNLWLSDCNVWIITKSEIHQREYDIIKRSTESDLT